MPETETDWLTETPRLRITPLVSDDAAAMTALGNNRAVSRNMGVLTYPFSVDQARRWIELRSYRGEIGFWLGIRQRDGRLIGILGFGGEPVEIAYWLGQPYWGRGYASEALKQFLNDAMDRFGVGEVHADVFEDNPASARVLEKLGFRGVGTGKQTSPARLEDAPVIKYRLSAGDLPAPDARS
ncbi:MAG: GNAT family N-acetyltransferase [Paracoccaceae bacterium]